MKLSDNISSRACTAVGSLAIILGLVFAAAAQSTSQDFPTPVTTSEIAGTIKARDIGDGRVTSYFYTFSGVQGDVFVNVVSKNFNGDIDIFIADGLKPLSKIVIYADLSDSETGRVIYLRQPEKLLLRVEGRTPNDDPATFRIKFAGSFVASQESETRQPGLPEVKLGNESGIRVNSVGTIVDVVPKVKPTPKPADSETAAEQRDDKPEEVAKKASNDETAAKPDTNDIKKDEAEKKMEVVVSDNIPVATKPITTAKKPVPARTRPRRTPPVKKETPAEIKTDDTVAAVKKPVSRRAKTVAEKKPVKVAEPDPLANIHLVILFKDGKKIERPMNEVERVTVDRGILTVVSKDGTIGRYSILDVLKTTIE